MKRNFIAIFTIFVLAFASSAQAISVVGGARNWWSYDGSKSTTGPAGDFMISGSLGKAGMHGTFNDEWAIVGVIAKTIVQHGGYFCPYQIQCANKRKEKKTWTMYYRPNGYNGVGCTWICEPGYSGENCLSQKTPTSCDTKSYKTGSGQKFGGLSLKTSGGDADQKENEVSGFNQWGSDPESDVLLGVVKFLEHGVIAGPVQIRCGRNNWKEIDSYVEAVNASTGNQKILCANGYKANDSGTDCEPVSADVCATQNMTFCANFPREKYNSAIHTIQSAGSCAKYFCTDTNMAFPAVGDTSCAECSTGVKGGPSKTNGVCIKCKTGEYFNAAGDVCASAAAFTKTDLQYGKDKTKNNSTVANQCWTKATPDEYSNCMRGKQ